MRKVLDEAPRRPAEINPQLSPFFEELVLWLLAKDRERRFASAAELARTHVRLHREIAEATREAGPSPP